MFPGRAAVVCSLALAACSAQHAVDEPATRPSVPAVKRMKAPAAAAAASHDAAPDEPEQPPAAPRHLIVLYLENHSFDNLYGGYPGVEGLEAAAAAAPQIDASTGAPYARLPQADPSIATNLPNAPFDITAYLSESQSTIDLIHNFYQEQQQIDGGRMDAFVTVSDAKGLTLGYYPTSSLPLAQMLMRMPSQVTICDHFFHAAFGGSFLNHIWLIAAQTPIFPAAPASMRAQLDRRGALLADGAVTPDGFVVNTAFSENWPRPAMPDPPALVPSQSFATIGDRLSDAGVDWAWYSGGWNDAVAGHPDSAFQFQHQPFVYFANYAEGTAARAAHLKDETDFLAALDRAALPPVAFVKPIGHDNEHPGYADLASGEEHVVALLEAVIASSLWPDSVVIITYDENGGFWDHLAPPAFDAWGPGTRVPAMVVSPFARGGVDSTAYDTTAILALIERFWDLPPLGERDAAQADLAANTLNLGRTRAAP